MLLLKNATVLTMTDAPSCPCDVQVENGYIEKIGPDLPATPQDTVLDLTGLTLMPGLIDAHCHLGMWEDGMDFEGADGNEATDPLTPQLRAIDGINPFDRCFEEAYTHGITAVNTGPGSANVIGGQFAMLNTYGRTIEEMALLPFSALKVAFGENPKKVYNEKDRTPMTRMATAALLRESLVHAQNYAMKRMHSDEGRDLHLEPIVSVLNKQVRLKCHAHRADDILTAMRIANEFRLDYTLDHCTEGHLIPDILAKEHAKVILGPLICERCKIELKNSTIHAPAILEKAGIDFAIMTDHPVVPIQYLPLCAAAAVKAGLSEQAALRAMTIHAAKICGVADKIGSIEVGKQADIAVFDGSVLHVQTHCNLVLIRGNIVHNTLG